ncbi:hypothetical protein ML462_03715 [Gramella lutea]|uniref:Uncharacterized protein n=1 Tax=Christiangramia lutea TaxID=1607951 RepID=A0A9X1V1F1_9FLAO|nr:hypothetical protein [Christiangramia lutea]MCH4822271.1 hypothetical protein [Christiangramia lutea]
MRLQSVKIFVILILSVIFTSCGSTFIYFKKDNRVKSAISDKGNPPESVQLTNINIDLGNWRLDALSASPKADYLALGMAEINSPTSNSNGKLEIYSNFGRTLKYTFKDSDLKSMIESQADLTYPSAVYAFHPFNLGYENNKILIAHIQPWTTSDLTPQDVGLKINLETGKAVSVEFFPRTARPALPEHGSKNKFDFEVINGEMFVNGKKLNGMPSGIDPDLHDEVTAYN